MFAITRVLFAASPQSRTLGASGSAAVHFRDGEHTRILPSSKEFLRLNLRTWFFSKKTGCDKALRLNVGCRPDTGRKPPASCSRLIIEFPHGWRSDVKFEPYHWNRWLGAVSERGSLQVLGGYLCCCSTGVIPLRTAFALDSFSVRRRSIGPKISALYAASVSRSTNDADDYERMFELKALQ